MPAVPVPSDSRPKNTKSKKGKGETPTPTEEAQQVTGTVPAGSNDGQLITSKGGKKLPAGKGQWKPEDVYTVWQNADTARRAQILAAMAAIPGLYKAGEAPPIGNIKAGIFRDQDFDNMSKVLSYSNVTGLTAGTAEDSLTLSLSYLYNNPQSATDYFGAPKAKKISLTDKAEASALLKNNFVNLFDSEPNTKEYSKFITRLNAAERKAGGAIDAAQKEDILLSVIQDRATGRTTRALKGEETKPGIVETGAFGRLVRDIRSSYADNGLPVDNKKIYKDAIKGLQGEQVVKNIKDTIALNAKVQFPGFAEYIDKGKTAAEMLEPYVDTMSRLYNIPANQINLADLKFVAKDPNKIMSLEETETELMKRPAYFKSDTYKTSVKDGLRGLARSFGLGI
jgi:hypothetical protein